MLNNSTCAFFCFVFAFFQLKDQAKTNLSFSDRFEICNLCNLPVIPGIMLHCFTGWANEFGDACETMPFTALSSVTIVID